MPTHPITVTREITRTVELDRANSVRLRKPYSTRMFRATTLVERLLITSGEVAEYTVTLTGPILTETGKDHAHHEAQATYGFGLGNGSLGDLPVSIEDLCVGKGGMQTMSDAELTEI